MNPALPAPRVLDLDPKRIAATSATIAVHVLALMLLLAPVQSSPPQEPEVVTVLNWEEPKPLPRPTPPPPRPVNITHAATPPRAVAPIPVPLLPPAPVDTLDEQPSTDGDTEVIAPPGDFTEIAPPAGPRDLRVLVGPPPRYPIEELRAGREGRVLLLIEVDPLGRPIDGRIYKSSGSHSLDRAALKTVLEKWRFEPAMFGGQAIAASALVPVEFVINE